MLVFFIVIAIIIIFLILIYFSTIKIEVEPLIVEFNNKIQIKDFDIKLYILIKKLKIIRIRVNKKTLENAKKISLEKLKQKIINQKMFKNFKWNNLLKNNIFSDVSNSNIKIEKLNLDAVISMENVIYLSFIVAFLDILISIAFLKNFGKANINNYKYIITPKQNNKLVLNFTINCIISIKIANIINIFLKKRGKKYERTSNRIFNGNSYEQYSGYGRC